MPHAPQTARTASAHLTRSWMSLQFSQAKKLLYVSNPTRLEIDVFSISGASATLVGQISDQNAPAGLATDAPGNLYVADMGVAADNNIVGAQVDVYAKGQTAPDRVIATSYWDPYDLAVGPDGVIYVVNIAPLDSFSPGSVTVFAKFSDKPVRTLRFSNFQAYGIFQDNPSHDLYVVYGFGGNTNVIEFPKAHSSGRVLSMQTVNAWGITEDRSDNLLVFDAPSNAIDVFRENAQKPSRTISATSPQYGAFDAAGSLLYVSNFAGSVDVYSYPGGALQGSIQAPDWSSQAWPVGVAVWPPATF